MREALLRPVSYAELSINVGNSSSVTLLNAGICGVRLVATVDAWVAIRPVADDTALGPTTAMLLPAFQVETFRTLPGDEIATRAALVSEDESGRLYVTEMG